MNTDFTVAKEKLSVASENIQLRDGDLRSRVIDAWMYNLNHLNANTLPAVQAQQFIEIDDRLLQGRLLNNLGENEIRDIAKKIIRLADELQHLEI
jgi:hypothetical protein